MADAADALAVAAAVAAGAPVTLDGWSRLRAVTPARIALGRAGVSLPTAEILRFGSDHALARDAVQRPLDCAALEGELAALGLPTLQVASRAAHRNAYLMRPDLGRRLDPRCVAPLEAVAGAGCDLALVVGDGLSALAVQRHAAPLLASLLPALGPGWRLGPVVIARQARVALGDQIGHLLRAALVAVLIGERPGLSSPDSLGIYLTWDPRPGRSDAERNCISNVRPQGLAAADAARTLAWLCREARRLQRTGVALKDRSDLADVLPAPEAPDAGTGKALG
jgi:ethanolamine ammonia-lyase small subunit